MRATGGASRGPRQRAAGGGAGGPLSLIHTNKSPYPRPALLSGQLRPYIWVFRDGLSAMLKAREETEANPTGTGWLVIPVPDQVEPGCWIVGRADALAELVAGEADAERPT